MRPRPDPEHLVHEALPHPLDAAEVEHDLPELIETVEQSLRLRARDEADADAEEPDQQAGGVPIEAPDRLDPGRHLIEDPFARCRPMTSLPHASWMRWART